MTTGRTLKTDDVIRSLNLVEIRRQQRRVTTLLNGDPKDVPLLSYRQTNVSSYRGENMGTRRWPPGGEIHQRLHQPYRNERETFWDNFGEPSTKGAHSKAKEAHLNATEDYRSPRLNNSPNDELTSSTPLPPINSHRNNCDHRQAPASARKKLERRRQMSPATEKDPSRKLQVTRNRRSTKQPRPPRNKSSKPVVKYQHQKVEPSAEERYRKYRQVTIDEARKVASGSTPEVWLRSDSGLSSVSGISALRRRHVQFQSEYEGNSHRSSMLNPSYASHSNQLPNETTLDLEGRQEELNGRNPGLRNTEQCNLNEDSSNAGLALEDSNRCHPSPAGDGSAWKDESSVRLPDIQFYNSSRLLPETRRFNPDVGETSRAFVFSYFDPLPPVSRSRDDALGSDSHNNSKSVDVVDTKTLIRRK